MKVLSFLGTGNYTETHYVKHDDDSRTHRTALFPEAIAALYEPSEIIVFATPKVRESKQETLAELRESLGDRLRIECIPDGNSEAELWQIFEVCANVVEKNDEIILDITHAFRSIPLLIFVVAIYLRAVKQINLRHIIYGAFEARDTKTERTPIFDLTPFVKLLDWTNAQTLFQQTGDAREIAKLDLPNMIVNPLTKLSEALLTNRPLEAQGVISSFVNMNMDHPAALARQPAPFRILADGLKESYREMGLRDPKQNPKQSLKAQFEQIRWYLNNQHYLHVITLMREWMVSWECIRGGEADWLDHDTRERVGSSLNERVEKEKTATPVGLPSDSIPTKLWRACRDLRNDLAHCGMKDDPMGSHKVIAAIEKLFAEFERFVAENSDFLS